MIQNSHLILLATSLSACTHVVMGGGGRPSPDGRYSVVIEAHGASGKAYSAVSKKQVFLQILNKTGPKPEVAFQKKYILEAGNLTWRVAWLRYEEVRVEFFDFRNSKNKIEGPPEAPQLIATHVFAVDPNTNAFRE